MSGRIARALPAILVFALLAHGCGRTDRPAAAARAARVMVVERYFEQSLDGCAPGDSGCAWVRISHPHVVSGPSRAAVDSMNAWIRGTVLEPSEGEDSVATDAAAWAATFLARNRSFRRDYPDAASAAWYERRAMVLHGDTLGVTCFRYTHERHGGGAHPLTEVFYQCFDSQTGRSLTLDDLLVPGARAALDSIGEVVFRRERAIPAGQRLRDAMFTFEGDRFRAGDNVGLGAAGLTIEFNPYEIAPYAAGPTSLVLPWSEVRWLLELPRRPVPSPR